MTQVRGKGRKRDLIDADREERILAVINGWSASDGPLNGSSFARKVAVELDITCTRQGLLKRSSIRKAFEAAHTPSPPKTRSDPLAVKADALQRRVNELEEELRACKEVIVRHQFNAGRHGMPLSELEAPLIPLRRTNSG